MLKERERVLSHTRHTQPNKVGRTVTSFDHFLTFNTVHTCNRAETDKYKQGRASEVMSRPEYARPRPRAVARRNKTGSTHSSRRTHCAASPERQPPAPTPAHPYQSRMPSSSLVRLWMASCSESYGCSCEVRGEVRVTVRGRVTVAPPVWRKPGRCARPGRSIYRLAEAEGRPQLALAGRAGGRIGRSLCMAVTRLHVVRRLARDLEDARRFEGEGLDGWPDRTRDLRRAHARGGHGAPRRRAGG